MTDRSQPTITGYFTNEAGKKYIMAVNRDFENSRTISFSLPAKPASVKEVSKTTGLETATNYDSASGTLSANFAPGEGRLYVLDESSASEANVTSLTADAASVSAGSTFKVKYGLSSVAQNVYAQDIKLHYDPATVEFVSAKSIKQGVSLLQTANDQAGNLQLILASEGPGNEVAGQADIVELTFKAKYVSQTAASEIKLTSARLADSNGIEYEAALSSVTIQVTAGISGDLNHDNRVTIGDLAIMAAHYGKNTNSPDWEQVKQADLNGDGKIDIEDLAALARKIIG
ncbi:cohesin domain-containing protein [Paenibacillus contaminans]|uniref:cohesin domain-containing protein n=1 Tax=Paenibacillus contaminans TaxID=450362 RepID=UPI001EDCCFA5|nr:cohesin domain-containing protein [Paenibacillus contaminans]